MLTKKRFLLLVAAILLIVGCAGYFEWLYAPDQYLADLLYQQPRPLEPKIKIIAIDEKTLQELGAFGTWDRAVYAELLDRLHAGGGPALVAFDVVFSEQMGQQGDVSFANACQKYGNVVVAADVVNQKKVVRGEEGAHLDKLHVQNLILPYPALKNATSQGFAEATIDPDGYIRQAFWKMEYDGAEIKSFSRTIYEQYAQAEGLAVRMPKLDAYGRFGFSYAGRGGDYDHFSLIDVLQGKVNAQMFNGSIVFVGAYAEGMQDNYSVASMRNGAQMYGVEIQANIVQALLEGETTLRVSPVLATIAQVAAVGALLFVLYRCKIRGTLVATLSLAGAWVLGGYLLSAAGYQLPVLLVPLAAALCCVLKIVLDYVTEVARRRRLLGVFKRYVAPQVVEEVVKSQDLQVNLSGEQRDIAVLFVDIRSFTSLSERLEPAAVVQMLNRYLNATTQAIFKQNGTVDKFIGDAAMAVFNSPFDLEDYEFRAVCAGLEIVEKSRALAKELQERFGIRVECGVGIHCGPAIVGNIGSEMRLDYTAIGDTVNTASRIESVAKGGQVLISPALKERLRNRIKTREAGLASLKGKRETMMLYEVMSLREGEVNE